MKRRSSHTGGRANVKQLHPGVFCIARKRHYTLPCLQRKHPVIIAACALLTANTAAGENFNLGHWETRDGDIGRMF